MSTLKSRLNMAFDAKVHTQAGLARAAGVKAPSVAAWFSGKTKTIKGEPLLKAATYLGVHAAWLATGEGQMLEAPSQHVVGERDGVYRVRQIDRSASVVDQLGLLLRLHTDTRRLIIAATLSSFARDPDNSELAGELVLQLQPPKPKPQSRSAA